MMQLIIMCGLLASVVQGELNPPQWPNSVMVFGPENSFDEITAAVNDAFAMNGGHDPVQFLLSSVIAGSLVHSV